jgi:uncharacterized small protein (DUF1192 family)
MFEDENAAGNYQGYMIGQTLDAMSVEELAHMIARLKDEIARLERAKAEKSGHMAAAQALFSRR